MTTYSFIDESGETRLVGTISPAPGGGSQPGTLAWQAFKTIIASEWNAATLAGFLDVVTLPTNSIIYDATMRASDDFDDSSTYGVIFGWDVLGAGRWLGPGNFTQNKDDWAGVTGSLTAGPRNAFQAQLNSYYGVPAFIKDAATAGPLQAVLNAAGDATQGTVTFWLYTDAAI